MQQVWVTLRSVVYASGFVGLWAWLAVEVQPLDAYLPLALPGWLVYVGGVIGGLGAVLGLTCVGAFIRHGHGTPAPFDAPVDFVAAGPYRYVRNPMYIGGVGTMVGAGLLVQSPSIVLLGGVGLLAAHLFVVYYEEPTLEHRFGDAYRHYKAAVRRWWPRTSVPAAPPFTAD